ncbi:MAG: glycoside hydrolase family 65 protein [Rhodospirillaceae bacterium]|nr:glycoside hydrolase family 65 protein [Rhodospirillaceae bacterium]
MQDWTLVYDSYEPDQQKLRETLCTLGNGYFCTRGAFLSVAADMVNDQHYPATYLAGGYNRLQTEIADRMIENEDLVNCPNWLPLIARTEDGQIIDVPHAQVLKFRQELDVKVGVLRTDAIIKDPSGRETRVQTERLVSMADHHMAAIRLSITPLNWEGPISVESAIDGGVINYGVKRYRDLASRHLNVLASRSFHGTTSEDEMISLVAEMTQSRLRIALAARMQVLREGRAFDTERVVDGTGERPTETLSYVGVTGVPITLEKVVALYTGKDIAISEPEIAAQEAVDVAPDFDGLAEAHARAWSMLWRRCDTEVNATELNVQLILRVHIFHLLQTMSHNSIDLDVGTPARGWSGEAYRGHVFWDELYILPFLDFRAPAIARNMLRYRYNRLPKARQTARAAGLAGAMFPWQSGSDGREESQVVHLNPKSGRWVPDFSWQQRHVNLAIAYNAWQHYLTTGDHLTLEIQGVELIVEVARLFASLATFNAELGRYEIHQVMGPDEYHEAYPDSDGHGLNNNAYTNVMVSWLMETARIALDAMDVIRREELQSRLGLTDEETARWSDIETKMFVPFHGDGIISQFEGYENLQEFDWDGYRAKYGDIQRLDRILEAEGDTSDRYKLSKQADVLMLFYLFNKEKVAALFGKLGYEFTPEMWDRNIDYYMARTSHGSTLSYLVHAWVLARTRPQQAWDFFVKALSSDIHDIQGGTTQEGIHLGLMTGTVDIVQRCLTGLDVSTGVLQLDPCLIGPLTQLKVRTRFKGHSLDIVVTANAVTIHADQGWPEPVAVDIRGNAFELKPDETRTVTL